MKDEADFDEAFAMAVTETLGHVDPNRDFFETDPPEHLAPEDLPKKGVIAFSGERITGHLVLGCVPEFLEATCPLKTLPAGKEDQLLSDWLGEMLNLVLGNFKRKMDTHALSFTSSPPKLHDQGAPFETFGTSLYGQDGHVQDFWFDCDSYLMCLRLGYRLL